MRLQLLFVAMATLCLSECLAAAYSKREEQLLEERLIDALTKDLKRDASGDGSGSQSSSDGGSGSQSSSDGGSGSQSDSGSSGADEVSGSGSGSGRRPFDDETRAKIRSIEMAWLQMLAKCDAWSRFLGANWIAASRAGSLGHICPHMMYAIDEYEEATPEEKECMESHFLEHLDVILTAAQCLNVIVVTETVRDSRPPGRPLMRMAHRLAGNCINWFRNMPAMESAAEDELGSGENGSGSPQCMNIRRRMLSVPLPEEEEVGGR